MSISECYREEYDSYQTTDTAQSTEYIESFHIYLIIYYLLILRVYWLFISCNHIRLNYDLELSSIIRNGKFYICGALSRPTMIAQPFIQIDKAAEDYVLSDTIGGRPTC